VYNVLKCENFAMYNTIFAERGAVEMKLVNITTLLLLLVLVACGGNQVEEPDRPVTGELTVDNVTANLTLPSTTGAVYMRIANGSGSDDALIGAEVPGCGTVELHEMIMQDDVMMMRQMEGNRIPIPAGETVMLERGGLHVMCIDKTGEYTVGEMVPVTLQFEQAGTMEVMAEIVAPGEMPMDMGGEE
jgi:periplasmic copper chaperone A